MCILAAWLIARGSRLPASRDWGRLAVLGFFMLVLGNGGVVWGEQYLPSGLTAVLIGTSPFWMVSVDAMLTRRPATAVCGNGSGWSSGSPASCCWSGPTSAPAARAAGTSRIGVLSVQIACAGWAVGSAYTRRHVMPQDVLGSAALQMFFGGLFMLIAGTLSGEWGDLSFNQRARQSRWCI